MQVSKNVSLENKAREADYDQSISWSQKYHNKDFSLLENLMNFLLLSSVFSSVSHLALNALLWPLPEHAHFSVNSHMNCISPESIDSDQPNFPNQFYNVICLWCQWPSSYSLSPDLSLDNAPFCTSLSCNVTKVTHLPQDYIFPQYETRLDVLEDRHFRSLTIFTSIVYIVNALSGELLEKQKGAYKTRSGSSELHLICRIASVASLRYL